jgi:tryptophan-rich sensory protein
MVRGARQAGLDAARMADRRGLDAPVRVDRGRERDSVAPRPYPAYAALLAVNLALNAYWCRLFFAERRPTAALVEILVLEATCLGLVALAARRSGLAAGLLAPYAAWVAFASFLNAVIVTMR